METIIHKELSYQVLGMAYTVHSALGPGLLEHAYKEAMCVELRQAGIPYEREKVYELLYKGENVGTYFADIVVDDKIILELKCGRVPPVYGIPAHQLPEGIQDSGRLSHKLSQQKCDLAPLCKPAGCANHNAIKGHSGIPS